MDTNQALNETSAKIAAINDEFRSSGQFVLTNGVMNLSNVVGLCSAVEQYSEFNEDNDPYGEHDFGSFEWFGSKVFWKIDYYNQDLTGWCEPLSPDCRRILTVMLAGEY